MAPGAGGAGRTAAGRSAILRPPPRERALPLRLLAAVACLLAATACGRLQSIPTEPARTPASWLASQPWTEIALGPWRLVVVQPTTSAIVYLLGLLTIGVGARFLARHERQTSRLGWGVALLLWGVAALLAGTSYEAFSYAIKCAGRETCAWTSWWEVGYLLLSVWSLDLMTIATARACATGRARRALSVYALANAALYALTLLVGAFVPVRFLLSFELLVIFAAPGVAALLALNARGWRRSGSRTDLALLRAWLGLAATYAAYLLYLGLDLTRVLWARGIWFSENDVLHLGLIAWMVHLARAVAPRLRDRAEVVSRPV